MRRQVDSPFTALGPGKKAGREPTLNLLRGLCCSALTLAQFSPSLCLVGVLVVFTVKRLTWSAPTPVSPQLCWAQVFMSPRYRSSPEPSHRRLPFLRLPASHHSYQLLFSCLPLLLKFFVQN